MAKTSGGVRTAGTQLPTGVSTAPITIEEAIRGFANQNWREAAQRAASPRERNLYSDFASAATLFLQMENPLVVRILSAGQIATRRGASDRQVSNFAKLAQEGGRRMIRMSDNTQFSTNERRGLLVLGNRIMNLVNRSILPGG
jgi:hypothetical protein